MKIFIFSIILSSYIGSVLAESKDRLLPSNSADAISVQVKQDNKILNLTIKNDSDMVFTSATLYCSKTYPDLRKSSSGETFSNIKPLDKIEIKIRILPNKQVEHYIELKDEMKVSCSIGDPRGREKKFYELM
jgi:hypothetical protein